MTGHFYCVRCKSTPLDDPSDRSDVCQKCLRTFYIVQTRVYTSLDKPRKFRWEHMMCADFSEHGDSELVKRFETREQAEKGIRRYIRKYCYGDYASNRHRYRIVRCEVMT